LQKLFLNKPRNGVFIFLTKLSNRSIILKDFLFINKERKMKIGLIGMSHLGCVFCAGFAQLGHNVVAIDEDEELIKEIKTGKLRIFENGLSELLEANILENRINLASDFSLLQECSIVILSLDTPLDDKENLNLTPIFELVNFAIPHLPVKSLFLVSSQVVVGTCEFIQEKINFARPKDNIEVVCFPENIRVGQALEYFFYADRFIIGAKTKKAYEKVTELLKELKAPKIWMDIKSAEISKHALNAFLASQVSFINEIADICDAYGADVVDVAKALKLDSRIGGKAYFDAGLGITSLPILRELKTLLKLAENKNLQLPVIAGILETNATRPLKIIKMLKTALGAPLNGKMVGIFGLTYKEGTAFIGKSAAPLIIKNLRESGIEICIYQKPSKDSKSPYLIATNCHALLFLNPEKEFIEFDFDRINGIMRKPKIIFDARNFLPKSILKAKGFLYLAIGRGGKQCY